MKSLIKILAVSSLLVIGCLLISACGGSTEELFQGQGKIDITVTNSVSTLPLSVVTIEVRETSAGAVIHTFYTDANGYYKFLGTVNTDYFFTFSKTGYTTSVQYTKTPQSTATNTLNVALVPI
jgi:hypothetical protein